MSLSDSKKEKNIQSNIKSKQDVGKGEKEVETITVYHTGGTFASNIVKAVVYVSLVVIAAVILSYFVIVYANDVFAFRKDEGEGLVSIDEYDDIATISKKLDEVGVIKYPAVFRLYAKLRKYDTLEFVPGDYAVATNLGYDKIVLVFAKKSEKRQSVRVTIREGSSVDDIIALMLSKGIGTKEGWVRAINEVEYDYWFLDGLEVSEYRHYRLEGYLYPDTYEFWSDSKESVAVAKMLDNFSVKFKKKYLERVNELGMTLDQVLTLASMIEKEAKYDSEYQTVSSVFHNRLSSDSLKKLQSDATLSYLIKHTEGAKREITSEDIEIDDRYNTYFYEGLPAGPICNPTIDSISAAMYPVDTEYYYFVADVTGYSIFATTLEEHKANIELVRLHKEALNSNK